ncbi:MAG TPA: prepilin-type N-terminal cleavage/methylation domain-containing protein [Chthoniobacteraceae bacterium]|jgi:prepilin-type N-terminal cleavage/methylation domain-containing protein|nr:prepilin-type N-terminal cleavage/methylation domain-containing protein [Chthoniobacteraceae bacterium]
MQSLHRSVPRPPGFTLIELLTVMAIIAILAGLILSVSGYAMKKGALSRAQSEIQAISTACESYKADNGTYPYQPLAVGNSIPTTGAIPSDYLDPRTNGNSASTNTVYTNASLELYQALTSDLSDSGTGGGIGTKNYIADMRPDVWGRNNMGASVSSTNPVLFISDPFGNSYGYSTANSTAVTTGSSVVSGYSPPNTMPGYNPTFDLWSTGGNTTTPNQGSTAGLPGDPSLAWVKNW